MSSMMLLQALPLMFLLTDGSNESGWVQAARDNGITIYSRPREEGVNEMKAIGMIDASPEVVWKTIRDYDHYPQNMPYIDQSKVIERDGEKLLYLYSVINPPMVSKRDYVIKVIDESEWSEGKGFLKLRWEISDKGPAPKDGMVRVKLNDGYWKLEPREGGTKTFATYYVLTDPGGSIPRWMANKANTTMVPTLFQAIRKLVVKK
jgi:hypothetical protein